MKKFPVFLGAALTSMLLGCASTPVAVLMPVGPNPESLPSAMTDGQLEVFSATQRRGDEANEIWINPTWQQHTDYYIYDKEGTRLKHVSNFTGHYSEAPSVVNLPPGVYVVEAQAKNYSWVKVPVVIESGRMTHVHLDDDWQPTGSPYRAIVSEPNGHPVGWRAGS